MRRAQREVQARGLNLDYNEIIVDGPHWTRHLPMAIEAFFGTGTLARSQRDEFLSAFNLTRDRVPLVDFDTSDWETPFRLVD